MTDDKVEMKLPAAGETTINKVMFIGTDKQIPVIERSVSCISPGGDRAPLSISFQESDSVDIDADIVDEVKRDGGKRGGISEGKGYCTKMPLYPPLFARHLNDACGAEVPGNDPTAALLFLCC